MGKLGNERRFREALDEEQSVVSFSERLGFELTLSDHQMLSRLSRACCFLPRPLGAEVPGYWKKRRSATKKFLGSARKMLRSVADFKDAEAWIETRFQVCSQRLATSAEALGVKECIPD